MVALIVRRAMVAKVYGLSCDFDVIALMIDCDLLICDLPRLLTLRTHVIRFGLSHGLFEDAVQIIIWIVWTLVGVVAY